MNAIISYDVIICLLANPPSLDPRPTFFNLRALRTHFSRALKKVPCPQSAVNGWAGAVLMPAMYALIETNPFNWRINPRMAVPDFPACFATLPDGTQGAALPYSCKEILTIMAEHFLAKTTTRPASICAMPVLTSLTLTLPTHTKWPPLLPQPPPDGI
jgi:hypothetical protein